MPSLVVDREALKSAVRAAIVIAGVFASADKVIGNQTTALFASFGSFALLVLAQFTGAPRTRLLASASYASDVATAAACEQAGAGF